jgi:hypothetical protein
VVGKIFMEHIRLPGSQLLSIGEGSLAPTEKISRVAEPIAIPISVGTVLNATSSFQCTAASSAPYRVSVLTVTAASTTSAVDSEGQTNK